MENVFNRVITFEQKRLELKHRHPLKISMNVNILYLGQYCIVRDSRHKYFSNIGFFSWKEGWDTINSIFCFDFFLKLLLELLSNLFKNESIIYWILIIRQHVMYIIKFLHPCSWQHLSVKIIIYIPNWIDIYNKSRHSLCQ